MYRVSQVQSNVRCNYETENPHLQIGRFNVIFNEFYAILGKIGVHHRKVSITLAENVEHFMPKRLFHIVYWTMGIDITQCSS